MGMESMTATFHPHKSSGGDGGGYGSYGRPRVDTPHHGGAPPPQQQQQQQNYQEEKMIMQQVAQKAELDMKQRIAQNMLTATVPPASGYDNRRRDYPDAYFDHLAVRKIHEEPQSLLPPWETDTAGALALGGGNPTHQEAGDLPAMQLHQAMHPSLNFNSNSFIASASTTNDDDGIIARVGTGIMDTGLNDAAVADAPAPLQKNRRVSFLTQDQFYLWDEQLDILKYVDEEFFNVAHFLIDVVGANNANLEEYMLKISSFEEEELKRGSGLLSMLFGCTAGDVDVRALEADGKKSDKGKDNDNQSIKYQLTEKLVNDFFVATKFRVAGIGSTDSSDETEETKKVTARTREIVRKINAYGLPLLRSSAKIDITSFDENEEVPTSDQDALKDKEQDDDEEEEEEEKEEEEFLDTFGKGKTQRQFFPVLPTADGDENDENDQTLSNQLFNPKPRGMKVSSTKAGSAFNMNILPTPASLFSSIFSKSATPSEEECVKRLDQIQHEMKNVQQMIDDTHNEAVQSACQKRISKLRDERRFYQIIQERYKLQSMMETTEVAIVQAACKERFKQLVKELDTLQLNDDDEEEIIETPADDDEEPSCRLTCGGYNLEGDNDDDKKAAGGEDGEWYHRVLQYVGHEETHAEPPQSPVQKDSPRKQKNPSPVQKDSPVKQKNPSPVQTMSPYKQKNPSQVQKDSPWKQKNPRLVQKDGPRKQENPGEQKQSLVRQDGPCKEENSSEKESPANEDDQWYERALQYVNSYKPTLPEEEVTAAKSAKINPYPHTAERELTERREQHPEQRQDHSSHFFPNEPMSPFSCHRDSNKKEHHLKQYQKDSSHVSPNEPMSPFNCHLDTNKKDYHLEDSSHVSPNEPLSPFNCHRDSNKKGDHLKQCQEESSHFFPGMPQSPCHRDPDERNAISQVRFAENHNVQYPKGYHDRPGDERSVLPPRSNTTQQARDNRQHPTGQRQRPVGRPVARAVDSRVAWLDDLFSEF